MSIEIEVHKFQKFKTNLYSHHSSKPGHITEMSILVLLLLSLACNIKSTNITNLILLQKKVLGTYVEDHDTKISIF